MVLIVWILFGIGGAIAASNKGRSGLGWFLLGVLLGPFALLYALLVKPKQSRIKGGPSISEASEERRQPVQTQ